MNDPDAVGKDLADRDGDHDGFTAHWDRRIPQVCDGYVPRAPATPSECRCRPPARDIRAEYASATYCWDYRHVNQVWWCRHGVVWRNRRAWGLGGTVWRELGGRKARHAKDGGSVSFGDVIGFVSVCVLAVVLIGGIASFVL